MERIITVNYQATVLSAARATCPLASNPLLQHLILTVNASAQERC